MVGMERVKRGIARYLDEEFTNKMTGWQKWVFGAGAAMFLENFSTVIQNMKDDQLVKYIGLIDSSGNLAVERVYQQLRLQAQKGPITFDVPMLGTVTLNDADVDKLYNFIMQS